MFHVSSIHCINPTPKNPFNRIRNAAVLRYSSRSSYLVAAMAAGSGKKTSPLLEGATNAVWHSLYGISVLLLSLRFEKADLDRK